MGLSPGVQTASEAQAVEMRTGTWGFSRHEFLATAPLASLFVQHRPFHQDHTYIHACFDRTERVLQLFPYRHCPCGPGAAGRVCWRYGGPGTRRRVDGGQPACSSRSRSRGSSRCGKGSPWRGACCGSCGGGRGGWGDAGWCHDASGRRGCVWEGVSDSCDRVGAGWSSACCGTATTGRRGLSRGAQGSGRGGNSSSWNGNSGRWSRATARRGLRAADGACRTPSVPAARGGDGAADSGGGAGGGEGGGAGAAGVTGGADEHGSCEVGDMSCVQQGCCSLAPCCHRLPWPVYFCRLVRPEAPTRGRQRCTRALQRAALHCFSVACRRRK